MSGNEILTDLQKAIREGKWDEAKQIFDTQSPETFDEPLLSYYEGVICLGNDKTEEGIELLKKAMGMAEEANKFPLAMAAAARIADADPNDANIRLRRADFYLAMGLQKAAYEYLLREFDFYRRRNDERALFFIVKKTLNIDETNLDLALKMAKILAHLGQKEEVRRVVESVIFSLQGRGEYNEAAQIQKEYSKLYEEP